jgi:hypothetical protein
MRHRDAFLELLSPALARSRRERASRTTLPAPRPIPCPETVVRTLTLRPR